MAEFPYTLWVSNPRSEVFLPGVVLLLEGINVVIHMDSCSVQEKQVDSNGFSRLLGEVGHHPLLLLTIDPPGRGHNREKSRVQKRRNDTGNGVLQKLMAKHR